MTTTGLCRSCREPIIWAVTAFGKRTPIDAQPHADGNIVLDERPGLPPIAHVTTAADLAGSADGGGARYKSHFATCPNAAAHRKKRAG